jgi:hypothetical protein
MYQRARLVPAGAVIIAASILAGCGRSSHLTLADLVGPSGPPTTVGLDTTIDTPGDSSSTSTAVPSDTTPSSTPAAGARWAAAAGNLAAAGSSCGNLALVSGGTDRAMAIVSLTQQGLWATHDGGASWAPLGQGPGSAAVTNRAITVVYDPQHRDTFWESGIYFGGGVYRTDDNGATFQALGSIDHSEAVSIDFTDPARQTLLSGRHESSKLFKSTDGGKSWADISKALPGDIGFASAPFVEDGRTYLLGTNHGSKAGVYRTTDGGATWTQVFAGAVAGQLLVTKADQTMYWLLDSGGTIKSVDHGATWTPATRAGTLSPVAANLFELANGDLAALGNQVVVSSSDHGAAWRPLGPRIPYPPTGMAYSAAENSIYVWNSNCGGNTGDAIKPDNIMKLDLANG